MNETTTNEEKKYCGRCKKAHPVSEFGKDKKQKDGLNYYCRQSVNVWMKRYYHECGYKFKR